MLSLIACILYCICAHRNCQLLLKCVRLYLRLNPNGYSNARYVHFYCVYCKFQSCNNCNVLSLYISDLHFNVFETFCVSDTETLKAMLTRQDVMAKNIQEILLRLNQTGGASQGPETPIEIHVAQSLEELAVKTERASVLQDLFKIHLNCLSRCSQSQKWRSHKRSITSNSVTQI